SLACVCVCVCVCVCHLKVSVPRGGHVWKEYVTFTEGIDGHLNMVAVDMVDDVQTAYYDNTIRRYVLKHPWMEELGRVEDPDSWARKATEFLLSNEQRHKGVIDRLKKETDHSSGVFIYQQMYGCELNDDETTTMFRISSFQGEDFASFDRDRKLYTPATGKAQIMNKVCQATKAWTNYLSEGWKLECIEWLKKHLLYGKETLERKVAPEVRVYDRPDLERNLIALTCMATGFYPRDVDMTWVRDGETQMDNAHTDGILPNEDETYQIRKTIEIDLEDEHSYTCWVDHSSLEKQLSVTWGRYHRDPIVSVLNITPSSDFKVGIIVAVGVLALILILVLIVIGFVKWKKEKKPGAACLGYTPAQREEAEDSSSNTSS
uniref:Ig-like domain-containing protein n=2 Tax=Latimeria chalumnae TaxID=7897 RepID=H3AH48_LATCH